MTYRVDPRSLTPAGWARCASNQTWRMPPHLALVNRALLDLTARKIKRLAIQMPPRHGKSEFTSGYFPGWYLGIHPDHRVLLSSYEATLAASWGRRVRDTLETHGPDVFGLRIRPDSSAKNEWLIDGHRGGMSTAGVGGSLTGKGADLLIVDDPVKNAAEANSEVYRDKNWDWWQSTARTRLHPGAVVVVIQTRWHEDDLLGRILKNAEETGEEWTVIDLPAVAIEDETWTLPWWNGWCWHREKGEALWPQQYPLPVLAQTEKAVGSYWWSALFQQRPVTPGGGILKPDLLRTYTPVDGGYLLDAPGGPRMVKYESLRRFGTMDLAATERTTSDYTVLGMFGRTPTHDLIALDWYREQIGTGHADQAARMYELWKPAYIGIEAVALGHATVNEVRKGDPVRGRRPLPVRALKAQGDKVTRALTLAAALEGQQVYVPASAPWVDGLRQEMREFPKGKHDDQVDVLAYAALEVYGGSDKVLRKW